jgi:hypothetical protein
VNSLTREKISTEAVAGVEEALFTIALEALRKIDSD